jgi:hypothetical protein
MVISWVMLRRLLGVVVDFAGYVEVEAAVGSDRILELLKGAWRTQMHGGGLKNIAGSLVHVVEHARIAPHFRIKSAAAGVEDSHDLPMTASKINRVAEGQTRIAAAGVFPTINSARPGWNIRP